MSWEFTVVLRGGFACFLACPCVDVVGISSKIINDLCKLYASFRGAKHMSCWACG